MSQRGHPNLINIVKAFNFRGVSTKTFCQDFQQGLILLKKIYTRIPGKFKASKTCRSQVTLFMVFMAEFMAEFMANN